MGVQRFLKSAFKRSLATLDAEEIVIGEVKIMAVIDETSSSNALGHAATDNMRTMIVKFPADAYPQRNLKSGQTVHARDESWQISCEDDAIRKGQVATTLTLIEPERRDS